MSSSSGNSDVVPVEDLLQFALINGIVYGDKTSNACVIHAPFTLIPYRYPRNAFLKAERLAVPFNSLYKSVAQNVDWLVNALTLTGEADEFTQQLLKIQEAITAEGSTQSVLFGILRSDYMLHDLEGDARNILQVEINTISSSFGSLSTKIADMFTYFHSRSTAALSSVEAGASSIDVEMPFVVPQNDALENIVNGIATAHQLLVQQVQSQRDSLRDEGVVVGALIVAMIVQSSERNFSDQRNIEFGLLQKHGLICRRFTLADIHQRGNLVGRNRFLQIDGSTISVAYFRAGYTPNDYPTADQWTARLMIERSYAIKCPNISLHLAGCKKIQQELARPGVLELFVQSPSECAAIRDVFAGLHSLDVRDVDGISQTQEQFDAIIANARERCNQFVMKPQREGGGNNFYGNEIVKMLDALTPEERAAYILMERIFPPAQQSRMVREGVVFEDKCICELGCFGIILSDTNPRATDVINSYGGYLLRVKPATVDEGGVAAGYAVLSSPTLID